MNRFSLHKLQLAALLFLAAAPFCGLLGCGGEARYDISGSVTHKGEPVPNGLIVFTQEGQRGGHAMIVNGKYDTASETELGAMAGACNVTIKGFEPADPDNPEAPEKPLFPPYATTIEITSSKSNVDFEVP